MTVGDRRPTSRPRCSTSAASAGPTSSRTPQTLAIRCTLVDGLIDCRHPHRREVERLGATPTGLCTTDAWKTQPGYATFSAIARWVLDPADPRELRDVTRAEARPDPGGRRRHGRAEHRDRSPGRSVGLAPRGGRRRVDPADAAPSAAITTMPNDEQVPHVHDRCRPTVVPGQHVRACVAAPPGDGRQRRRQLGTLRLQTDAITFLLLNPLAEDHTMKNLKHFLFAAVLGSSGIASANAFNINEHDAQVTGRGGAAAATNTDAVVDRVQPRRHRGRRGHQRLDRRRRCIIARGLVRAARRRRQDDDRLEPGGRAVALRHVARARHGRASASASTCRSASRSRGPTAIAQADVIQDQSLRTYFITPTVGINLDKQVPGLSIGGGVDLVPGDGRARAGACCSATRRGTAHLGGDAFGIGGRVGVHVSPADGHAAQARRRCGAARSSSTSRARATSTSIRSVPRAAAARRRHHDVDHAAAVGLGRRRVRADARARARGQRRCGSTGSKFEELAIDAARAAPRRVVAAGLPRTRSRTGSAPSTRSRSRRRRCAPASSTTRRRSRATTLTAQLPDVESQRTSRSAAARTFGRLRARTSACSG